MPRPASFLSSHPRMNALLENDLPDLDSLELDDAADFDRRLSALERIVGMLTQRLENDVFARIRVLEEALTTQALTTLEQLAQETTDRQDQLAVLAGKVSHKIDHVQHTTINVEEKLVIVTKQVQTSLEDRIEETRKQIAEETGELRSVLQARLDKIAEGN